MKKEILFVQKIAEQADTFYNEGKRFGEWAFQAFRGDRAQMKKLERIANSSLKVSDVLDYIKKQTGKHEKWRHPNNQQQKFGPQLIDFISSTLRNKRDMVCTLVANVPGQTPATDQEKQRAYLALIREFVKQVAAQYELEVTA